ncbi:MAG: hypothetical protein KIS87_12295 [Phycisphaeraceae bacterium]|nr:hypothetical protein [Phycisphaeraceae bacterium]
MAGTHGIAALVAVFMLSRTAAAQGLAPDAADSPGVLAWLHSDDAGPHDFALVRSPAAFAAETGSHDPFEVLATDTEWSAEALGVEVVAPYSPPALRLLPVVPSPETHDADAFVIEPLSSDRLEARAAEVRLGAPLAAPDAGQDTLSRGPAARLDRRMTAGFGKDAEELTPLSDAYTMMQWDVGDWLHLRGTGVGRRPDEDERRFLAIGAEAGVDISHNAGLRFGYEFLRAGADDSMGAGLGADTLFARLQLRF